MPSFSRSTKQLQKCALKRGAPGGLRKVANFVVWLESSQISFLLISHLKQDYLVHLLNTVNKMFVTSMPNPKVRSKFISRKTKRCIRPEIPSIAQSDGPKGADGANPADQRAKQLHWRLSSNGTMVERAMCRHIERFRLLRVSLPQR